MLIRDILFKNIDGCSDGNCIIRKPSGQLSNGGCKCFSHMSRTQLYIVAGRLRYILDKDIDFNPPRASNE